MNLHNFITCFIGEGEAATEVVVEVNGETYPITSVVLRATGDWDTYDTPAVLVIKADSGDEVLKAEKPNLPENFARHIGKTPSQD